MLLFCIIVKKAEIALLAAILIVPHPLCFPALPSMLCPVRPLISPYQNG